MQPTVCLRTLSNDQVRLEFYITITVFGDHKSKNVNESPSDSMNRYNDIINIKLNF